MGNIAGRVTLFVLAGVAAGFLTWLVSDGTGVIRLSDSVTTLSPREMWQYQVIFMTWGASIAILLGLADILAAGQNAQWPRVVGIGALVGVVSGVLGGAVASAFFGTLYSPEARTAVHFLGNVLARAIGWGFIGAFAGTAPGWRKLSVRVGRNGFFGGLIGGLLGGTTFEIIPYLTPGIHSGGVSRFCGLLITGACIGLFIALVQELFKEAWIRVVVGRNEGKEILVDKAQTTIGRSELADVSLFGDQNVAKTHAVLDVQPNGRYALRDVSQSPVGVRVNDQPVSGATVLTSGDRIQIAGKLLVFYERATRTRTAPAARDLSGRAPGVRPGASPGYAPTSSPTFAPPVTNMPPPTSAYAPPTRGGTVMGAATAYLIATSGPYTGTAFPIRGGTTVGRDPQQAEVSLPSDSKVSRLHARFLVEGAGFVVEDSGSSNGTFVNGQRVTRQALAPGDTVQIGTTAFRFE